MYWLGNVPPKKSTWQTFCKEPLQTLQDNLSCISCQNWLFLEAPKVRHHTTISKLDQWWRTKVSHKYWICHNRWLIGVEGIQWQRQNLHTIHCKNRKKILFKFFAKIKKDIQVWNSVKSKHLQKVVDAFIKNGQGGSTRAINDDKYP